MKIFFSLVLLTGLRTLFSKICQPMKQLIHVPNIILGAVDEDDDYDGDDGDDNYDGDTDQDHEWL